MKRIAKIDKLLTVLAERIFIPLPTPIALRFRRATPQDRATAPTEDRSLWQAVDRDLVWGEPDGYFWFAGSVEIPAQAHGKPVYCRIEAQFGNVMGRSDPQCLVRVDGRIVQGGDANHREFLLTPQAEAGRRYEIVIEAGTIEDRRQLGFACTLLIHDPLAEKLYFDLKVPAEVASLLQADDARRHRILNHIDDALLAVDLRPGDVARFHNSLLAAEQIAARIYADADAQAIPTVIATGHTHIDVAWLWRVRETRQKTARSFATALALLDQYPEYRFMYNQCILLDYLAQDYPELFTRVQEKVKTGQFEIEGAMWLEPDVNVTGAEALVRHILHGVRYHERTFGVRPRIVWLPDTFGYSAALPQIMQRAGLDMFVTHKLSWNGTNRMPYETFHWQGIDGTKVPAYFLTTRKYAPEGTGTTYCADLSATYVMGTWRRHSQQALNSELFMVYGHGDGGGGPTRAMVEQMRRMQRGIPGCPKVEHQPMGQFFDRLGQRMRQQSDNFPTWVGELYLETHRGTLTSVAKNKRDNRQAENTLRVLECLASLALTLNDHAYPQAALWDLWQIVLLNQFHDILPGSSIGAVYEDSDADYQRFFAQAEVLQGQLLTALGQPQLVLNVLGRRRDGLLWLDDPGTPQKVLDGTTPIPTQRAIRADGSTAQIAPLLALPAAGGRAVRVGAADSFASATHDGLMVSPRHLENAVLRVELTAQGHISRLVDKRTGRDALQAGKLGNRLLAYRDYPLAFDAWDIDDFFEEQSWVIDRLISATVVETGPYRAAIRLEWAYEASRIVQILALEAGGAQLEVDCWVDWHEQHTLLKAEFPIAVVSDEVRSEIQFGHVRRPTHRNTSWDQARFECSMQRWVDLSEEDFGVALLNDCKYGYDAKGQTLRLTLLRGPTYPWPQADQGEHRFRYAVLVHHGRFAGDGVVLAAEAFNLPLRLLGQGEVVAAPAELSLLMVNNPAISVESLKKAEEGDGLIVRLYETRGQRASFRISLHRLFTHAARVDLLERAPEPLPVQNGQLSLSAAPFEIITLKLWKA